VDSSDVSVCVHLVGGVWGLFAPGLLGAPSGYGKSYAGITIIFLLHFYFLFFHSQLRLFPCLLFSSVGKVQCKIANLDFTYVHY
jgi:ammonia channel protein AmtB